MLKLLSRASSFRVLPCLIKAQHTSVPGSSFLPFVLPAHTLKTHASKLGVRQLLPYNQLYLLTRMKAVPSNASLPGKELPKMPGGDMPKF